MKKIYAESWALFKHGAVLFAVGAALVTLLNALSTSKFGAVGMYAVYALVAFWVHRYFLKGEDWFSSTGLLSSTARFDQKGQLKFVFSTVGLNLLPLATIILFALWAARSGLDRNVVFVWMVIAAVVVIWVSFGALGTILPAIADRDPRYSLKAGLRKTHVLMVRLLLGPGVALMVYMIFAFTFLLALDYFGVKFNPMFSHVGGFVGELFSFFSLILTASCLCSVYRMIVPAPELSAT